MSYRRLVLFLGAGFSAGAGLPVMATLGDRVRRDSVLSDDELHDFDQIQTQCQQFGAVVGQSARNIEQLASFLSILKLARPDFEFTGCRNARSPEAAESLVLLALARVLSAPSRSDRGGSVFNHIYHLSQSAEVTLITTNYDLACEIGSFRSGLRLAPNPNIVRTHGHRHRDPFNLCIYDDSTAHKSLLRDPIPLIKLHGSTNWFKTEEGVSAANRMARTQEDADNNGPFTLQDLQRDQSPLIIPPSVLKPILDPFIQSEWRRASAAMSEADAIWFVGYSFPDSDSFMTYFLGAALAYNPRLAQIAVIDPSHEVCFERASRIFNAPHHRDIYRPVPAQWEDVQVAQLWDQPRGRVLDDTMVKRIRGNLEHDAVLEGRLPGEPEEPRSVQGWRNRNFRGRGFR